MRIFQTFNISNSNFIICFCRGFCFLEYESHKAASLAKRRLETGRIKVWSCDIIVDWADPQEEPDDETMSQVNIFFSPFFPQYLKHTRSLDLPTSSIGEISVYSFCRRIFHQS